MTNILLVPVHLDALCVNSSLSVVEAQVDFTRLPYWDGVREVNPDIANISEELVPRPFQDRGLQLQAGIHLHWALPDGLTKGISPKVDGLSQKLTFPAVPNRWLVTRSRKGTIEAQTIVESDYLYPDGAGDNSSSIAVPFPATKDKPRPFRYLGRTRPFNGWSEDPTAEYLATLGYRLTAVGYEPRPGNKNLLGGYGEPTFAAFYPNCHNVFGFHDPALSTDLSGVQYEIIGWYSDPLDDCLHPQVLSKAGADALKDAYGWKANETKDFPQQSVFYARITMQPTGAVSSSVPDKPVAIAVGNTPTQALSAYLACTMASDLKTTASKLEEQLEALHVATNLDNRTLDVGPRFQQARHERGFAPVPGGTIWTIRKKSAELPASNHAQETLPEELAHFLNQLNRCQQGLDRAGHQLVSMQRQLFADWYKYMLCVHPPDDTRDDYPDVDEVRYFIKKNDLAPIERQRFRCAAFASQLASIIKQVPNKVSAPHTTDATKPYVLQSYAAQTYQRPREPVLLLADVEPTKRHGQDGRLNTQGLLDCHVVPAGAIKDSIAVIRSAIEKYQPAANDERIGFQTWSKQPWNPFVLEWSVEVFSVDDKNNLDPADRTYAADFITSNYTLAANGVDLALEPQHGAVEKGVSIYSGSSILTPHAKFQLQDNMDTFLSKRLLQAYYDDQKVAATDKTDNYFDKYRDVILKWYAALPLAKKDAVVDVMVEVSKTIEKPTFHALAQSLTGFNEALLMHKQTLQLPIADPLGLDDDQDFIAAVKNAVGRESRSAPQPLDDFHPLRTGVFKILALRLVDTFGRVQNLTLKDGRVMATEIMTTPASPHLVSLPPRLVQPARLAFRWLAADRGTIGGDDEPEMNAHPATTPVCGWLLPNNLDNSLMVYDGAGHALGSVIIQGDDVHWADAPGVKLVAVPIANPHLKKLVNHLLLLKVDALNGFFTKVDKALENIDPEGFAQHQALALLMGRPIAVVRAALNLELCGAPAINQDWNVFRREIERTLADDQPLAVRQTDGLTKVRFPIQLGDSGQWHDGLVGYWRETWSGSDYNYDSAGFVESSGQFSQAVDDTPQKVTMLVDPRGVVHARMGILPAQAMEIPPDQYATALKAITITFLTAPILSPAGKTTLPVPAEPGYEWAWLEKAGKDWAAPGAIKPASTQATWSGALEIHDGWLRLAKTPAKTG